MNKLAKQAGLFLGLSASWALAIEVPDWPLELEDQPGERLVLLHVSKEHAMYESAFNNVSLTQTGTDWEYPKVEGQFNPRNEYRGYFNPYICYQYDSANDGFVIQGLVETPLTTQESINAGDTLINGDADINNNDNPEDDIELVGYYHCNAGSDENSPAYNPDGLWSGNYLNYITMSRMDLVRFQLYGGKKPDDGFTMTSLPSSDATVDPGPKSPLALERAQIPPDSHGWTIGYNLNSSRFVVGDASGEINADPDNNPESVCYPENPTEAYDINLNPVPSYQECDPENPDNGGPFTKKVDDDGVPIESDNLNLAWDFSDYDPITQEEYEALFLKLSNTWRLSHLTPFKDPDGTNHTLFANATVRAFDNAQTSASSLTVDLPDDRKPTLRVLANTSHNTWQWGSVPAPMHEARCWVANAAAAAGSGYSVGACDAGDGFFDFRVRLEVDCEREKELVVGLVGAIESDINDIIDAVQDAEEQLLKAEDKLEHYEGVKEELCGSDGNIDTEEVGTTLQALQNLKKDLLEQIADRVYQDLDATKGIPGIQEYLMRDNLVNVDKIIKTNIDVGNEGAPFANTIEAATTPGGFAQTVFAELDAYKDALDSLGVTNFEFPVGTTISLSSVLDTTEFDTRKEKLITELEAYRLLVNALAEPMTTANITALRNAQQNLIDAQTELQNWLKSEYDKLAAVTLEDTQAYQDLQDAESDLADAETALTDAETALTDAGDALGAAETALTAADTALGTAETALADADTALGTAETTLTDAGDALGAAETALTAADTALGTAETALADADTALGTAETALTDAGTALGTAETTLTDAGTALGTAETALTAADTALGTAETALTDAQTALNNLPASATPAETAAAQQAVNDAQAARDNAETARDNAQTARDNAQTARDNAETARDNAQTARDNAQTARDNAQTARDNAQTARDNAQTARDNAQTARDNAQTARDNAQTARDNAQTARDNAQTARDNAQTARDNAQTARDNAQTARDNAQTARDNAQTARDNAQTARDNAQGDLNAAPLPTIDGVAIGDYWTDATKAPQQMITAGNQIGTIPAPVVPGYTFTPSSHTTGNYVECTYNEGDRDLPEVTVQGPQDGTVDPGECTPGNSTEATTTAATGAPDSITAYTDPDEPADKRKEAVNWIKQLIDLQAMIDAQQITYTEQALACTEATDEVTDIEDLIDGTNEGGDNSGNDNLQNDFDSAGDQLDLGNERFRNTARRDIRFTRACAGNNVTGLIDRSGFLWGLMTTSYSNPDQGGVLRVEIGGDRGKIIDTINNLRVASEAGRNRDNSSVDSIAYNQSCITPGSAPLTNWENRGNCHNIADPNAEYLLEGLRYFSGEEDFRDKAGQAGVTDPGEDTRATPTNDFYNNGNGSNTVDTEYYVDFMGISVELPVAEEERNGQRWWTSDPIEEYGACSESMQLVYNVAGSSFDNDDIFNIDIPDPQDPYTTWNLVKSGDFGKTAVAQIEKSNVLIGASGADYVSFKFKNKDMHGQYRKGISSGGSYYVADITKHFDGLSGDVHNVYEDEEDGVRGEPSADCQGSAGQNNDGCSENLVDPLADIQGVRLMAVEAQHTLPRIRIPKKPLEEMDLSQADGEVIDEEGNTENAKNSSEYRKNSLFKEALADEYIEFIPVAQTQFGGDTYNPTNRIAAFEMVYEYNTREGFTNDGEPLIIDDQFYNKFTDEGRLDYDFEDTIGNPTIPRLVYDNLRLLAPSNMDESINEGRPAMQFIVTYNEQEAGSNFEGNFVVKYTIRVNADEKLDVIVEPLAASTSNNVKAGYIMAHADTESLQLVVDSSTMTTASTDPTPDDETDVVDSGYAFLTTDTEAFLRSPLWHAVEAGQPNRKQNYYVLHNITHEGLDYMLDNMNVNTVAPSSNFSCENGRRYLQSSTAPTSAVTGEFTYSFTAWFDFCGWAGDLRVYRIDEYGFMRGVRNGNVYTDEPFWSAGELLNKYYGASSHGARNVQFLSQPEDAEGSIIRGPAAFSAGNVLSSPLMKNKLLTDRIQSAVLGGDDSYVSSLANWLRGDDSNETDKGGAFRPRKALSGSNYSDAENNILGDIYGSSLVYVGAPTDLARNSQQPGYKNFYDGNKNRRKMVYVGANDGMVHAFDALTGEEIYALVLNSTANKISRIATPGYDCNNQRRRRFDLFEYSDADCHKFLVDGKQVAADVQINNEWKTVLVGTTGRGGRGLYAIDITNPGEIGDSPSSPNGITAMWEIEGGIPGTDYENLYYTFPEPTITQLSDGTWVVVMANGYDDAQGTGDSTSVQDGEEGSVASLFLINIEDGSLVDEIILDPGRAITDRPQGLRSAITAGEANGLSTPLVLDYFVGSSNDIGSDGKADTIYAGDLYGNLYRIDVRLPTSLNHSTVFTTMEDDSKVRQAITSKPLAKRFNYAPESGDLQNGVLIFVGTGKFLERSDDLSGVTNSFYAIFDDPASISSDTLTRANLLERKLSKDTCQDSSRPTKDPLCTPDNPKTTQIDGEEVFVFADEREKTDWRGTNKSGWYINLFERGERIINNGFFVGDQVSFYAITPSFSICVAGGKSYAYVFEWETGLTPNDDTTFVTSTDNAVNEDGNTGAVRKWIANTIITNYSIVRTNNVVQFFGSSAGKDLKDVVSKVDPEEVNTQLGSVCTINSKGECVLTDVEDAYEIGQTPGGGGTLGDPRVGGGLACDAGSVCHMLKNPAAGQANWIRVYRP
ncbi:PilC/PilY family type IV pilus protein [Ostreibacterium oceani]|uniref:PilY1 beta-propeller domain-containing protein n=1 Tax=Ostreibacterium oceani TaxID=2654998 RepID=A0A6N7ERZ2_9GAMM|nr:PilC/PilY family type IV pilus protein [Ostreibacterium oceani]MPV85262.1 hypothetical protein [Ostreibacterium oceani]